MFTHRGRGGCRSHLLQLCQWYSLVFSHVPLPSGAFAAKAGLNREIMRSGWGLLVRRLEAKAPGRIQKVTSAYTSQRSSGCGYIAAGNRKSQAVFACLACHFTLNADVNAARNIAAGHAVTARGRPGLPGRANREPHLTPLSA